MSEIKRIKQFIAALFFVAMVTFISGMMILGVAVINLMHYIKSIKVVL